MGVPEKIALASGTQFKSEEFEFFMNAYGKEDKLTPIYSPQSILSIEQLSQTIETYCRRTKRTDCYGGRIYQMFY